MFSELGSADLVGMFTHELRLCKVQPGENVLIFTDPRFLHPAYPPAGLTGRSAFG